MERGGGVKKGLYRRVNRVKTSFHFPDRKVENCDVIRNGRGVREREKERKKKREPYGEG